MSLQDSVSVLPGVGSKRLEALKELGVVTISDLLWHFPFRYEDMTVRHVEELIDQDKVTLKGTVLTQPVVSFYGAKKNRISFKMAIEDHVVSVYFFNQHYLKNRMIQGQEAIVFGKWEEKKQALLGMKWIGAQQDANTFEAVYHVNKSIKQQTIIQLVKYALDDYEDAVVETLPHTIIQKYRLMPLKQAIRAMHFPQTIDEHRLAKERMIYEELFVYQFRLSELKRQRYAKETVPVIYNNQRIREYITQIPFELTTAQKRVSNEMCRDLLSPFEMNRLLQGDVGSGKTVVASIGILAAIDAGYQVALMVPTEILAQQHFKTFQNLLHQQGVRMVLLTSSTKAAERKHYLHALQEGNIDLIIGTHALIQEDVLFKNLGFVIIDEQHRFGVMQRQLLKSKASIQNVLYMTATPIPRTLAMTTYGEMDVSIIDELPKGRQVVQTKWVKLQDFEKVLDFTKKQVDSGRQAYFIAPLIEDSEESDLQSAQALFDMIATYYKDTIKMALLHGKMKPHEKEEIMTAFAQGHIQLLVSTTVIEVGVNVPNATVMIIHDAERFGMAQLHQLRGRVGRGVHQSYCLLIASPKTQQGKERMMIMCQSNDGFYLSQKDLEMRGSGDAFGSKQSGLPAMKCADFIRDQETWSRVIADVSEIITHTDSKEYLLLKEQLFDKMEASKKMR